MKNKDISDRSRFAALLLLSFSGELHSGMAFILDFNNNKDEWVKNVFPNQDDAYDQVWHHKFVFKQVGNGDYLSRKRHFRYPEPGTSSTHEGMD